MRVTASLAGREMSYTAVTVPDICAGSSAAMVRCTASTGLISSPCTPLISSTRLPGLAPLATTTGTYQCWPVAICTPWK